MIRYRIPMLKHVLVLVAWFAISCPALAQSALDCSSVQGKARASAETQAMLASLMEAMGRQQAELEAGLATARATWSEQDSARFSETVFQSKRYADFNKEIALLLAELRSGWQALQRGEIKEPAAGCRYVARLQELVRKLGSVYARQSVYMNEQLRKVKPAQAR